MQSKQSATAARIRMFERKLSELAHQTAARLCRLESRASESEKKITQLEQEIVNLNNIILRSQAILPTGKTMQ